METTAGASTVQGYCDSRCSGSISRIPDRKSEIGLGGLPLPVGMTRPWARPNRGEKQRETETAGRLMLVGHLPHLSRLASLLLVGDPRRDLIPFRNGGIVYLVKAERGWLLEWVLTPELAGV